MDLPVVALEAVVHIGSMNAAAKGPFSYEGSGLSVSLDPETWEEIAELGGCEWWRLRRVGGTFLSFYELSEEQREHVREYGLATGLVERAVKYTHTYYDSELDDDVYTLHDSYEAACDEVVDEDVGVIASCEVVTSTAKMRKLLGGMDSGESAFEHLLCLYVSTTFPGVDGIWWADDYGHLSAPRGVIFPERIQHWNVSAYSEDDDV
jgi:hypothetical protein